MCLQKTQVDKYWTQSVEIYFSLRQKRKESYGEICSSQEQGDKLLLLSKPVSMSL